MARGGGRIWDWTADDASILHSAIAGRAGGAADSGIAQARRARTDDGEGMGRALVVAKIAGWHSAGGHRRAGSDCMGAVGFSEGGRMVRATLLNRTSGAAVAGGSFAANSAIHSEPGEAASAFIIAAWVGESL